MTGPTLTPMEFDIPGPRFLAENTHVARHKATLEADPAAGPVIALLGG